MPIPVILTLAIARRSLADAARVADAAEQAGVAALRLLDEAGSERVLDPSVAAGYLAGRQPRIGYLVDVPTTHQAPYNTARRLLSLDRATDGQVGLVLRPGRGDEVSDAVVPSRTDAPADRWSEYAEVVTRLWESFPRQALIGDQERALVVDDSLIRPIDYDGAYYRVAGPLDGPSSRQGRPLLVAADVDQLGWHRVAAAADLVLVAADRAAEADRALRSAAEQVGRPRREVALVGRVLFGPDAGDGIEPADRLAHGAAAPELDGIELVPTGDVDAVLAVLADLARSGLAQPPAGTLRASLELPPLVGSAA